MVDFSEENLKIRLVGYEPCHLIFGLVHGIQIYELECKKDGQTCYVSLFDTDRFSVDKSETYVTTTSFIDKFGDRIGANIDTDLDEIKKVFLDKYPSPLLNEEETKHVRESILSFLELYKDKGL